MTLVVIPDDRQSIPRAERLKPERMRQTSQDLVAPVVLDDRLSDHGPEARHALTEPYRAPSVVERRAARTIHHDGRHQNEAEP